MEHKLPGVVQIAVKPEINLTFASGLRSILRGDPNVVMVGEIRDLETAEIAVRASLTGHLVFSTLHTNDAIGGITRLVDMGVEPFLVASSVRAFLAQRLVRSLCPQCKQPAHYSKEQLTACGFAEGVGKAIFTASSTGCAACRSTGYHGRLAIYEIVLVTERNAGSHFRAGQRQRAAAPGAQGRLHLPARIRLAQGARRRHHRRGSDARDQRGLSGLGRAAISFMRRAMASDQAAGPRGFISAKIIRPALVCRVLLTVTATVSPRNGAPWFTTIMAPFGR